MIEAIFGDKEIKREMIRGFAERPRCCLGMYGPSNLHLARFSEHI